MRTAWETTKQGGPRGIIVDAREVTCWSGTPANDSGTSCTLAQFFRGEMQDLVIELFGYAVLVEVVAAICFFRPVKGKRPRSKEILSSEKAR